METTDLIPSQMDFALTESISSQPLSSSSSKSGSVPIPALLTKISILPYFLKTDSTNILFENRSRNTFENAVYSKEIINRLQIKKWGIVTSASHMKRAIATFEKEYPEINFKPIPVDFRTANSIYWGPGNMQGSINLWRIYIHETVGYWVYKLTRKL